MSKFDGVLGRSTQPLETVSKVLSARAPGKSADPRLPEDNRLSEKAAAPER